jgi:hypothetical protein
MSSTVVDSYLNALLALSGNTLLADARKMLLERLSDNDLSELVVRGMGREFARGGLEEIASLVLDVIARDPNSNGKDGSNAVGETRGIKAKEGQSNIAARQGNVE